MPPGWLDRLEECLWSGTSTQKVWMILDAARDPAIVPLLGEESWDRTCLYRGTLPPVLKAAAPYVIQLDPKRPETRRLLTRAWGHSWGVLLTCEASLKELIDHLRTLLMVRDPRGNRLLFRYYDPRVLRVYLPTCRREELGRIFGPVQRFWAESEPPDQLLEISESQNGLRTRTHDLDRAETGAPRVPTNEDGRRWRAQRDGELVIRQEQLTVFFDEELRKFEDWMLRHLRKCFPQRCKAMGGELEVRELIQFGIDRSASHRITSKRDVCKYIDLMMVLGREFDTDGRCPWAPAILRQPGRANAKMAALYRAAKNQLTHRSSAEV